MSRPSLANLGLRAQLAIALRLLGWSGTEVARILGVSRAYSTERLHAAKVPYPLTTARRERETRSRRRGAP